MGRKSSKKLKRKRLRRKTDNTPPRKSPGRMRAAKPQPPAACPVWRFLPHFLLTAFMLRALVALYGDFTLHPDETNQYLESAHKLAFGNGITQWEMFYGARSWIVPGFIALWLKLFDLIGLGEPRWYVGGVKLVFCAVSLAVPAAMYVYGRRYFGETAGRVALVAGVFWYEIFGFAHKPMLEILSSVPLLALLALYARPGAEKPRDVYLAAFLAVFVTALRVQYAPVSLLLFVLFFLRTERKRQLVLAASGFFLMFGVFDLATWKGELFQSYLQYLRFNLNFPFSRVGAVKPTYQYVVDFALASAGIGIVCLAVALRSIRRYGLLLAIIALIVTVHSTSAHKEYRMILATVPIWLLIGSDLLARRVCRAKNPRWLAAVTAAVFALVSSAGILNALPYQDSVYRAFFSNENHTVRFLHHQPPIFAAYRYLSAVPEVGGVWQVDRPYANTPGYYYLHRKIPFYDFYTGKEHIKTVADVYALVTHIVTINPDFAIAGYSEVKAWTNRFHQLRILRRDSSTPEVRKWREYRPVFIAPLTRPIVKHMKTYGRIPPSGTGIRFTDR